MLGKKWGGKLIFGGGVASTAFITLLSPWLAEWNYYALVLARVLMGVFEGVTFASLYTIWAKWIPPSERSRVTTQANSGSYTGAVFSMVFFAYLAETAGWRSIFWFSGSLGLLWFAAWAWCVAETPEQDPKITTHELAYIKSSLESVSVVNRKGPSPWRGLLTSKAVWALNVALFCETWGFYTLLTLLPKYFKGLYDNQWPNFP